MSPEDGNGMERPAGTPRSGGGGTGGRSGSGTGSGTGSGSGNRLGNRPGNGLGKRPGTRSGSRQAFTVLEGFAGRRSALPFALVVMAVLGIGLVSVLALNTAIDQGAFQLQQAQQRQTNLTNQEQLLQQQVAGLSQPGALASRAAQLGLVPNQQPAFLDPSAGTVLGVPSRAAAPPTTAPPVVPTTAPPTVAPTGTSTATPTGTSTPGGGAPNAVTRPASVPTATPDPPATPDPSASAR